LQKYTINGELRLNRIVKNQGNFASGSQDTIINIWDASNFSLAGQLKDSYSIFKLGKFILFYFKNSKNKLFNANSCSE